MHGSHVVRDFGLHALILLTYYAVETQYRQLFVYFAVHQKLVGLLKTLIHLVQLWALILSECLCGASAAIWSPTVKHNSHRAGRRLLNKNISKLGCMVAVHGGYVVSELGLWA